LATSRLRDIDAALYISEAMVPSLAAPDDALQFFLYLLAHEPLRKQRNLCLPHCCRTLLSGLHFGRVCRVFGSLLSLTRASCVSVSVGDATNGHALSNIRESWKMSSSFCAISLLCRVRRPEAQRRVQLCTAGLDLFLHIV